MRTQLAVSFAVSRMLFGWVAWGHCVGVRMTLHGASACSARKMQVLYRTALRWAVAAPRNMQDAALYVITS